MKQRNRIITNQIISILFIFLFCYGILLNQNSYNNHYPISDEYNQDFDKLSSIKPLIADDTDFIWNVTIGGSSIDFADDIATDSNGNVYINCNSESPHGIAWVYDLSGKLLAHQGLAPGNNILKPGVSNQVVILRVVIDDRMYHRKLYVH